MKNPLWIVKPVKKNKKFRIDPAGLAIMAGIGGASIGYLAGKKKQKGQIIVLLPPGQQLNSKKGTRANKKTSS